MLGVLRNACANCFPDVLVLPEPGAPVIKMPSQASRIRMWSLSENERMRLSSTSSCFGILSSDGRAALQKARAPL
jgi:hypothetical protein